MKKQLEALGAALAEKKRKCVEAYKRLRERLRQLDAKKKKWCAIGAVLAVTVVVFAVVSLSTLGGIPSADALSAVAWDDAYLSDSSTALLLTDGQVSLRYLRKNLNAANGEVFMIDRVTDQVFSVRFLTEPTPETPIVMQLRSPQGRGSARQYTLMPKAALPSGTARVKLVHQGAADKYGIKDPILLLFSGGISAQQLQTHLQFSGSDKTSVQVINNVAVIKPQGALEYNRRYSLSVTSGLEVNGQPMGQAFSTQFFTVPTPTYNTQDMKNIDYQQPTAPEVEELQVDALYGKNLAYSFDPNGSLTLVFSDSISESALRSHLSITPSIEYGLYLSGGTAIITPDQPLQFDEDYLISITAGLESGDGLRLSRAAYFDITTRASSLALTVTSAERHVLDLTAPIELEFALENAYTDHVLVDLTLFRMDNYEQYRTILSVPEINQNYELFELDSKTEILRTGLNQMQFDNPGKGIYLVQASVTDPETNLPITFYQCFNVTELSVYLQIANDRTLAWVNSSATAAVQSGLKVELSDRTTRTVLATGVTGADGSCELTYVDPVPENVLDQNDGVISIYNAAGGILYTDVTATLQPGSKPPDIVPKYFTFFFTDRLLYHPTDTILFWGYVKPHLLNPDPLPTNMRIIFDKEGLKEEVDVAISPDGVFTGELSIEQVQSAQYTLGAYLYYPEKQGEEQLVLLEDLWLEAKDFGKPTFVLTSTTTKELFTAPEQIEVTSKLTFYDGTPVPNYPLELSVMNLSDGNVQEVRTVQTDATGTARFLFKPDAGIGSRVQNGPVTSSYTITLAQDGETVRTSGSYTYQPAGLVTDVQIGLANTSQLNVTLRTNQVRSVTAAEAPSIIALANEYLYGYDNYRYYQYDDDTTGETVEENHIQKTFYRTLAGRTADVGVQGTLDISYYDIEGDWRELSVPLHAVTQNGIHQQSVELKPPSDPNYNVYAEANISCVDNNLNVISSLWSYNSKPPKPSPRYQRPQYNALDEGYSFSITRNNEAQPLSYSLNQMGYNDQTVDIGDTLTFQLCLDGKPIENEGKLLYQLMQDQPLSQQITTESSFQVSETFEYAQSVHIAAAYFDGKAVHPVQDTALRANLDSVKLNVEIRPDKEVYRPGETVNLKVHVSDQEQQPLASSLCVSVVDESVFALKDQVLDVVPDLYWRMAFPGINFRKYTTSLGDIGQFTGGDGGKGGSGVESYDMIRKDFKDTAFFYSTKTDARGNAQISFPLPDNTTSWRITTVSVGGALYGGNEKKNVVASLPFFARPVITSKYLAGDEVVMLAKSNGSALEDTSQVNYSVRIQGNGLDKTITAAGLSSESIRISFGELETGEYTVSTTAQFSSYRDTVVLPLTVIPSNLEMVVNREVDPMRLADLNITRYPVTLTFYDAEHAPFYKSVSSLLTHFCYRADQRLSRYVAKKALSQYLPPDEIPQHLADNGDYITGLQAEDGGISWYQEDEISDPILTTKVLLVVGDKFNTKRMLKYYQELLNAEASLDPVTRAAVYAGLAVLKEPDATRQINRILEESSVPMQEKLYYLAGLAFGGDTEQASALYKRDVAPYLTQAGDGTHLAYTNSQPTDDQLTATAWLTASKLGLPEADEIARYFSKDSWGIRHIFESMVYVTCYNTPGRSFGPIQYSINGTPGTLSLGVAGQTSVTYNKSEFENLSLQSIPQGVSTLAYYVGEPDDASMEPSKDISIQKEIVARDNGYWNVITITLSKDAPIGSYDISDWIPSNMRFFSMLENSSVTYTQELQKMYFSLNHSTAGAQTYTITYQTRKSFDAKTLQDRTYIIHADSGSYNFAERKVFAE